MPGNPINLLWMVDIIAECATAAVIYRRRAQSSYPAFFSLLIFLCAKSLTLVALSAFGMPRAYFYVYWIGSAVRSVLIGGVIGEVALVVLRPLGWLPAHFSRDCMLGAGLITVLAVVASPRGSIQYAQGICGLARHANEIISWTLLLMASAVLILSGLFEVSWDSRSIGISVGLLVELWISSVSAIVGSLFGIPSVDHMNWVRLIIFVITNCIWIASFVLPETRTRMQLEPSPGAQETRA